MAMVKYGRTFYNSTIMILVFSFLCVCSSQSSASQSDYELSMRNSIMDMHQKFVPKIDGFNVEPPDLFVELNNLEKYAREYVSSFQTVIPVKNKLKELLSYHEVKREKRLGQLNQEINDITRLHGKYSELAKKLEYKRDQLIIINAGKLLADYAALPDSGTAFLTDRFMAMITGSARFVPEGGLGSDSASRRLKDINLELDQAHKDLHKTLYTEPANPDELFKLTRQGELQAKKCQRLAYDLQNKMRTQTRPNLINAENTIEANINRAIGDVDRILTISPSIAQCVIRPVEVSLNQSKPQQQLQVYYLYSSGLETQAKDDEITYKSADSIVSVDQHGVVTGHETGNTEVVAEIKASGKKCSVPVTVTFPPPPGKKVTVPNLWWMDQATATKEIQKAGLVASFNTAPTADHKVPYDTVVRQRPTAGSRVAIGSTVWITMNRQPNYPALAELLGVKILNASPPYQVNTEYSMLAVTDKLNPNGQYMWWWKVDGESLGNGQTMEHTFQKDGVHIVEVEMSNIVDRREYATITERINIELPAPKDYTVDFDLFPQLEEGKTYKPGDTVTFTEKCENLSGVTRYNWYVDGNPTGSGPSISYTFTEKGSFDVTLGIQLGSNFDEGEKTKTITVGEQTIGKFDPWVNRFKDNGQIDNLKICSEYYIAGSHKWSECKNFRSIGPVDGYSLCTGEQSDGWNTGFLVYSKQGSDKLSFETYHYNFNELKGFTHYSGDITQASNPEPVSISASCRANAADVSWTNENGSKCSTRIWKYKSSDFLAWSGVDSPTCSSATISPHKLRQCEKFAKKAVEQFEENLKDCNLVGPEWHDRETDHKQWCLDVSDEEARDLTEYRDKALKTCAQANPWCESYAKRAVEQNEENINNQCGYSGQRWGSDYNAHFNWCTNTSQKAADSETGKRDKDLQNCIGKRQGPCKQYAEKAVKQNSINMEQGCGFCGQRWQPSYENHFNWCLQQPQSMRDSETNIRYKRLQQCGSAPSSDPQTFYEPCYNDYRLDNCLTFGQDCEKPAADRFCEENGYTEASGWNLEQVRPTYIIDDRSLCDEEACAGFSDITCRGNKNLDNQNPTCTIKLPKSGVVLSPGKTISFRAGASDPDRDKLTYKWVFDGGIPAKKDETWHGSATGIRWKQPGTYAATVVVTDDNGGTCTDSVVINVQDVGAPFDCDRYADQSVTQNEENLKNNCGFTGDLWHSGKSGHVNWCRNHDQKSATRNIELRSKALNECTNGTGFVTPEQLNCEINQPAKIAFPDAGKSVNFAGSGQGAVGSKLTYNWKFGEYGVDPATSTKQNPGRVVFKWAGSYPATLTVTDDSGNTCQDTRDVLVYDPQDPREFCEGYTDISQEQNQKNVQNSCGFSGEHWHDVEMKHQDWCASVSLDQAKSALEDRDEKLRQCSSGSTNTGSTGSIGSTDKKENLTSTQKQSTPDQIPPSDFTGLQTSQQQSGIMGTRWVENELGWKGVWTRRGNSNTFDALWTYGAKQEKAVLTINIHGNEVTVKRQQSPGSSFPGQKCEYKGTLAEDNITVAGTYGCDWATGPFSWQATISGDSVWSGGSGTLSCVNNDNEENGCCCFKGTHTYLFASRPVADVLARFDTGRRFNCKSTVSLDVKSAGGWQTIKKIQANSSRNGSEVAPIDVPVLVNGTIEGFRISDGCVCCIDSSQITLNGSVVDGISDSQNVFGSDGIRVVSATYGGNCGVKKGNDTSNIAGQCNGKVECRYTVDHRIIGDPAYGCAKTYNVQYQCGGDSAIKEEFLSAEAGWGDKSVRLTCESIGDSSMTQVTGTWRIDQSNGYVGELTLSQYSNGQFSGRAEWAKNLIGSITGYVSDNSIDFTIDYSWGKGFYQGTVSENGTQIINGTTKSSTGETATWTATLSDMPPGMSTGALQVQNLSGLWEDLNGHKVRIVQNGNTVSMTALENKGPVGWKNTRGQLGGDSIDASFNGWALTGKVTANGKNITWSNGSIWTPFVANGIVRILNLSGVWEDLNGHKVRIVHNGNTVSMTALENKGPVGWKNTRGQLGGDSIDASFNGWALTGKVTANSRKITWSNGSVWTPVETN